jgi:polyhydroxybutyrate depolymerase
MKTLSLWLAAVTLAASGLFAAEPAPTKWTVDGVEREAMVHLPSSSSKSKPPVILAFHGHGGNMYFAARGMAFQNSWPEAIVVYPQGLPTPGIVVDLEGKKPGWQHEAE